MDAKQLREQIDAFKNVKILKESEDKTEYFIRMPIAGIITRVVEANTQEEALDIFMEGQFNIDITSKEGYDLEEFDIYNPLVNGNVFYGPLNAVEIEKKQLKEQTDKIRGLNEQTPINKNSKMSNRIVSVKYGNNNMTALEIGFASGPYFMAKYFIVDTDQAYDNQDFKDVKEIKDLSILLSDNHKPPRLNERYGEDFEQMPDPAVESVLYDFFNYVSERLERNDKISKSHLKAMIDDFLKIR